MSFALRPPRRRVHQRLGPTLGKRRDVRPEPHPLLRRRAALAPPPSLGLGERRSGGLTQLELLLHVDRQRSDGFHPPPPLLSPVAWRGAPDRTRSPRKNTS
eukprot:220039-Prymnesium_polylepis.1